MNNQGFQGFATTSPSQTQVYPDGTVRIVQNANQMIATSAIAQEQHPHQHPQIIQNSSVMSNKVQSQTVYFSQGQGQAQQAVIMKTPLGNTAMTTPPMSFNSTVYSSQGQNQGQGQGQQGISVYSASQMNIQVANTPPNGPVNTIGNDGTNAVMMAQQNGVINEITSYTVAQPIQAQEAKNYNNPIFVLPSPSTPTPQINFTTSTNSQSTIVQVQQTPPQNPAQQPSSTPSQYVIAQKQGQAMGMTSTQQVILQTPPTPYGTNPTTSQVVLAQNGQATEVINGNYSSSMVSPTQIQYQYSVTPPLSNDKDVQIKQEGKVSPEMSISGSDKLNGQEKTISSSQAVFSSSLISNTGRLFNKISSPTTSSMFTVDSTVPVDLNGHSQEKENSVMKKESLSPAGSEKDKLEQAFSQDNGKSQVLVKDESIQMNTSDNQDNGNNMNIDSTESKIAVMTTVNSASIATTLDPSAVMTQTISSPQNNINMVSGVNTIQNVGVINPVNKINIINGMNNNVNYIPASMNIQGTTPSTVNINGMNTIQGVQVATAIPQTINTMNNMNVMNGNANNIINISSAQQAIPLNSNNSINLYYNQGQNVMNGTPNTMVNYTNVNMMKNNINRNSNGFNARTKNSHIVDPDVPIEVLIKRRKNTEAARRSRLRKAERIQVLTEIVHNLEEKNREYTMKIAELQGEQANWLKKETEYTTKIKQLQERLKIVDPEAVNDENDKNSFNMATPKQLHQFQLQKNQLL
ncbi:hypothetical protein PIROE2DRAFT_9206 [Piromyces sp. E2]|nr:hypothetical protein PIROE2DRAFT_9206 [Piromyces sp. E2]|eukprot:OUM64104.1 hypothetical protein PIROE2DRAFT_9206 [Piromyces sp. E2]